MKGKIFLYVPLLLIGYLTSAQNYTPVPLSGFTQDVFADSGTDAQAVTSTFIDATNHVMYTAGFAATNNISGGVLNSGTIVSGSRTYQLANYNAANAIYLSLNGTVANTTANSTISLQTPASFSRISLLAFSTEGTSTVNVQLNFTDGTNTNAGNFTLQDWFSGTNAVYSSFGRIARLAAPPYTVDGLPNNPRWYPLDISLSCANQMKTLQSVTVSYISQSGTSGRALVLALSGVGYTPITGVTLSFPATCGNNNGGITVAASGGTGTLSYSWNTVPVQTTSTASGLAAGTYIVTITDANGCSITKQDAITQTGILTASLNASPAGICLGESSTLTVTTNSNFGNNYNWNPNSANSPTINVSPTDTMTYTVTVINMYGCIASATLVLPVKRRPISSFSTSLTRLCMQDNDTLRFTGTADSSAIFNWNFGNGTLVSGSGIGPYVVRINQGGNNIISLVVSQNGCLSDTFSRNIVVDTRSQPALSISPAAICSGDTVQVSFTGAIMPGAIPVWNWGGGSVVSGSGLGPYRVRFLNPAPVLMIINNNTCSDTSQPQLVNVTPEPKPLFTPGVLQGCYPLTVSFINTTQNGVTYNWSFGDGTSDTAATPNPHVYNTIGTYPIILTASNGICTRVSDPKNIIVKDPPIAGFSSNPMANGIPMQMSNARVTLNNLSQRAVSYHWYFGDGDSSASIHTAHRYTKPGNYTIKLVAINEVGCIDSISAGLYVVQPDSAFRIPNAFSPNGDGINDRWVIPGLDIYPDCRVEIFDRYGQVVYKSTGYTTPWDGTRNSKPLPIGTYYYIIRTDNLLLKGWVLIVR